MQATMDQILESFPFGEVEALIRADFSLHDSAHAVPGREDLREMAAALLGYVQQGQAWVGHGTYPLYAGMVDGQLCLAYCPYLMRLPVSQPKVTSTRRHSEPPSSEVPPDAV